MMDDITKLSQIEREQTKTSSEVLMGICCAHELFHSQSEEPYISVNVEGRTENFALQSADFKSWLRQEYFATTRKTTSDKVIQDVVQTLTGKALYEGRKHEVYFRIAHLGNRIYIDIADKERSIVTIDQEGWRIANSTPIKFRRSKNMKPLPIPTLLTKPEFAIQNLKAYLNIQSENDFKLLVAWLVTSIGTPGPYLVLVLYGEQGTAKSTTVRVLRSLVDPNVSPLRRPPKNSEDLMVATKWSYIIAMDNMSRLPDWLSDDLCVVSTGGGLSKRKLHSDDDEVLLDAKRPIIANGIDEFVARGDLASRSVVLSLPKIDGENRRSEVSFWSDFERIRPEIFGGLLQAVSVGLRNAHNTRLTETPRMADAWEFITAAESAFNWPAESCFQAFKQNQFEANQVILDNSMIYPFIRSYATAGFSGTAQALLDKIRQDFFNFGVFGAQQRFFPSNAQTLSDSLRRIAEPLRMNGVEVRFGQTNGSNSKRVISINLKGSRDASDACVAPETNSNERGPLRRPFPMPPTYLS